jgi:protease I
MTKDLKDTKVAFLATDGVEQVELDQPWSALADAGAQPVLVSLEDGEIQAFDHLDKGDTRKVDVSLDSANPADYAALVLPGGVANGDFIRADSRAADFVRSFFENSKPVGVICHGSWVLIEAGVVKGRTLTSWPSLQTDLRNAGANWVDQEVVVDNGLVSSRKPDDLPAFCAKVVEEVQEGRHAGQTA